MRTEESLVWKHKKNNGKKEIFLEGSRIHDKRKEIQINLNLKKPVTWNDQRVPGFEFETFVFLAKPEVPAKTFFGFI